MQRLAAVGPSATMTFRAEVAEWQTRRSQTPLRATSSGFESRLRHQPATAERQDLANCREVLPDPCALTMLPAEGGRLRMEGVCHGMEPTRPGAAPGRH